MPRGVVRKVGSGEMKETRSSKILNMVQFANAHDREVSDVALRIQGLA